jgi:hypothetical protein
MTFLVLTIMQLTMVQHARIMTDYAAYCATRAGIVFNADNDAMTQAATLALVPTMGRADTLGAFTTTSLKVFTVEKVQRAVFTLPIVRVTTLSPRKGDFTAALTKHLNGKEIDFDDIRPAAQAPNELSIEVKYLYRMPIPFANKMLQMILFASRPNHYVLNQFGGVDMTRPNAFGIDGNLIAKAAFAGAGDPDAAGIIAASIVGGPPGGFYFPMKATYTMRMQSNAFLSNAGN